MWKRWGSVLLLQDQKIPETYLGYPIVSPSLLRLCFFVWRLSPIRPRTLSMHEDYGFLWTNDCLAWKEIEIMTTDQPKKSSKARKQFFSLLEFGYAQASRQLSNWFSSQSWGWDKIYGVPRFRLTNLLLSKKGGQTPFRFLKRKANTYYCIWKRREGLV